MKQQVEGPRPLLTPLSEWAARPFKSEMDLMGVFLLTGAVVTFAFAWVQILHGGAEILEDVIGGD